MARRRVLVSQLVSLDAYDRWGYPDDEQRKQMEADVGVASTELHQVEQRLRDGAAALSDADRRAWSDAHVQLLDRYVGVLTDAQSTEKFVAEGERKAWLEVADGARPYVDENGYYVRHDPEQYRALFGFEPG